MTAEWSTSVTGRFISPVFIFKRKRIVDPLLHGAPEELVDHGSDNGWIEREIFSEGIRYFFQHTNSSVDRKALLLFSYINLDAIELLARMA